MEQFTFTWKSSPNASLSHMNMLSNFSNYIYFLFLHFHTYSRQGWSSQSCQDYGGDEFEAQSNEQEKELEMFIDGGTKIAVVL